MKKENNKPQNEIDDMLPEYDLRGKKGVRGKYFRAYRQGFSVRVINEDGTVSVTEYAPQEGAVVLDPDVSQYFPDADSVNQTLRSLIALIPANKRSAKNTPARSRNATTKKVRA